jgi:hypothetical protein
MQEAGRHRLSAVLAAVLLIPAAAHAESPPAPIDLQKPFAARSPWRLEVTQGPAAQDYAGDPAPGAITLCLQKSPAGHCASDPSAMPPPRSAGSYEGWEPHYLTFAGPVFPHGHSAPPLLMLVTASVHAGDGGQAVVTQLFKYDHAKDRFERVYSQETGTNNNEEVRLLSAGPLAGRVIFVEPTSNAPFGYWVTVNAPDAGYAYKPVLRYRSATHYGDGNRLAVIDSEMANIQQRLGFWRPGAPLPLPVGSCPKPRLVRMELWCD